MNIAVVGGGERCYRFLKLIETHEFKELDPKVVAVADKRIDAPGFKKARKDGLFITKDYNDFFDREDINLIMELTGNQDLYNDILKKKKKTVRAIDQRTSLLFWEVSRAQTFHRKAKQELQKTRTLYDVAINELIQEDVLVIGSDYRILDINESLLNKMKLTREEAIGRPCYEITHHQKIPCDGEAHPCPLVETLQTGRPSQATHVHLNKDKHEIYYSIACYPLFEDGLVVGAVEIARDITKDINIQKVMMQQEKLASIGRLAAGVAHEINNPLTTILTTAMLIQEDLPPEDLNYEELETIANETLRCRKIVTSLLDFARQNKPNKKDNQINEIVVKSIILTKKQAAFKDIEVAYTLDEQIPRFLIDEGQIQQALINLILNAVESTEPGSNIHLSTAFDASRKAVQVVVRDTGEGMSEEEKDKIFDPFYTTKENGTGLGLAITHGIIEQHGGTITFDSVLGQGSTFKITFPLA
jgi:signal transduction histidine kinase